MSEQRDQELSALYARTPRQDSPSGLDKNIIEMARQHAPQKQSISTPRWISIAATACLVGLTVIVIKPLTRYTETGIQPVSVSTNEELSEKQTVDDDIGYAVNADTDADANTAMEFRPQSKPDLVPKKREMQNQAKSAEYKVKQIIMDQPEAGLEQMGQSRADNQAISAKLSAQPSMEVESAAAQPMLMEESSQATVSAPATRSEPIIQSIVKPSIKPSDSSQTETEAVSRMSSQQATKEDSYGGLSEVQFSELIDQVKKLIQQGKLDQARIEIQGIKSICPECKIPQAIIDLLAK